MTATAAAYSHSRHNDSSAQQGKKLFGFSYRFKGGQLAYYFLLIDAVKEPHLRRKLAENSRLKVRDYGEIVAAGYGIPSEAVKLMLREKYAADF